jgi:hypothetical protein
MEENEIESRTRREKYTFIRAKQTENMAFLVQLKYLFNL